MITTHKINSGLTWFEVVDPNNDEQEQLNKQGVTSEFLFYALDPNENARMELDKDTGNVLIIFDILAPNSTVTTEPIAMIFTTDGNFYTVTRTETSTISDSLFENSTQTVDAKEMTSVDIFLNGAFVIMSDYINEIKNVNRRRNILQVNLSQSVRVRDIISLTQLSTQNIYIGDSLVADKDAILQFKHLLDSKLSEQQKEFFNDIMVENNQAINMSKQSGEVISALNDTYSSVHSQNLDKSLRLLTVVQAIMAVPTVITGFYGMNTFLPFANSNWAWLGVIVSSTIIMFIILYLLIRINFFDRK